MFGCGFAPRDFISCNGQVLPIQRNTALFSLLGTTYGGNGVSTFQLPDLGGISPMHSGQGNGLSPRVLGETGGEAQVPLNISQLAMHSHNPSATTKPVSQTPGGKVWSGPENAKPAPNYFASQMTNPQALNPALIGSTGGTLPHNNLMSYLVTTIGICVAGEFPPHG